jgi:hypothetical protein
MRSRHGKMNGKMNGRMNGKVNGEMKKDYRDLFFWDLFFPQDLLGFINGISISTHPYWRHVCMY